MRVLAGGQWRDGFLDPHRGPGEYRVRVLAWRNLERLTDMYAVVPRSPRLVWNYLREVGPAAVARKVVSRSAERFRNEKFVSVGIGRVLEAGDGRFAPGATVCFLAPCHPACAERVVLPGELLATFGGAAGAEGEVLYLAPPAEAPAGRWWRALRGWTPDAGVPLAPLAAPLAAHIHAEAASAAWDGARRLPLAQPSPVAERRGAARPAGARPRAVLFGYGNYAKTLVIPEVAPFLDVVAVHEIDPTQMPAQGGDIPCWDTAPLPRPDEAYEALLIAGYHHTHAPMAVEALRRGAYAVAEKPVVVDAPQREALLQAVRAHGERFFSCFHKRYSPLNDTLHADLGIAPGEPVDYHCVVFEIPLPELHWYRWPNSHSRLVSNGCHWVDHFLFLNGWSDVARAGLFVSSGGMMNVSLELANGAAFTMALTDHGSRRIGVQEHVELRANGRTVRIANSARYEAEGPDRVLRRRQVNKMRSYVEMYSRIGRAVAEGRTGDSLRSIELSTGTMLMLEDLLRAELEGRGEGREAAPAVAAR